MTPNEQTAVEALVKEIELMCAYSNAVSMALRSPGGRTHAWTLGKISHLYDQQCKVESALKALTLLEASPTVAVSRWIPVTERLPKESEAVCKDGMKGWPVIDSAGHQRWTTLHPKNWNDSSDSDTWFAYWFDLPEAPQ